MGIGVLTGRFRNADGLREGDRRSGFLQAKTIAGKNILIRHRVQIGEAAREFNLIAVDSDRAIGRFAVFNGLFRKITSIN